MSLQDGDHKIEAKNIKGMVDGVQLYEVKNTPSQTTGLDLNDDNKPYFGIFLASQNRNSFSKLYIGLDTVNTSVKMLLALVF